MKKFKLFLGTTKKNKKYNIMINFHNKKDDV